MGTLADGYTGSGKLFKRAFNKRPEDFKRRILYFLTENDVKLLRDKEQYYLDMIKYEELNKKYYNLKKSADGMDSETASKSNLERVMNNTHHLLGSSNHKKMIEAGTHFSQKPGWISPFVILLKEGKHPSQQKDWINPLSGDGTIQRKSQKLLFKQGRHNTQIKLECPHCQIILDSMNAKRWHFDKCKKKDF